MDYDDNDFQSQNLHLAGEGSTKFPPALKPYALSKFDFDESLQGHLRFDSLVESEVFLGIESNEDNQWIDAYSRGSDIEFSSTAAEPCSISRHNNVWSEATSSESVEMLLKSVGQEEFNPRQTVIQESDACDELAFLAKQMETNPKPDNENEFKDNVIDLQPLGCIHENLSVSKEDVEMEQPLAGVSQSHEEQLSIDGGSSHLQPQDVHRNIDLPVSGGNLFADGKSNDSNQTEVETVTDGSLDKETQDDSSASGMKIMNAVSTQNISCDILNIQNMQNQVSDEEQSSLQNSSASGMKTNSTAVSTQNISCDILNIQNVQNKVVGMGDEEQSSLQNSSASGMKTSSTAVSTKNISSCDILNIQNVQNAVVGMGDEEQSSLHNQISQQYLESSVINRDSDVDTRTLDVDAAGVEALHSAPMEESLRSGSVVEELETRVSSLEDSLDMGSDGISDLQKADSSMEDTCLRDLSQGKANGDPTLIENVVEADQPALNICDSQKVAIKEDSNAECQLDKIRSSSCETYPNFQHNADTIEKQYCGSHVSTENELVSFDHHMDTEILVKSEASVFSGMDNNISTVNGVNSDSKAEGFSSFNVLASTKSCILGEAPQVYENNEPDRQSDREFFCQDISVNDQESKRAPQIHCDVDQSPVADKGVGSSSLGAQTYCDVDQSHIADKGVCSSSISAPSLETELTASSVSVDVMPVNNSAPQLISENVNLPSCEIVDVSPLPSRVVSAHEVTDHNEIHRMTLSESTSVVEKDNSKAKIAEEASISTIVESFEQELAPCPVTGTEHNSSEISGQLLCEKVNNCLENLGAVAIEKLDEPQGTPTDKVHEECTKEVGVAPVQSESTEKQGDEVTVSSIKDDKEAMQENHDKPSSKLSGDILFANEGSVSSAPLPDSHIELHETGGCPADASSPSVIPGCPPETEKDGNVVKDSTNLNPPVPKLINRDAINVLSTVTPPVLSGSPPESENGGNQVKDSTNLNPPVPELINRDATNMLSTVTPSVISGSLPDTEKDGNQVKGSTNLNPPVPELINRDSTNTLSTDTPSVISGSPPEIEKDGHEVKDPSILNPTVTELINGDATNVLSTVTPSVISGSPPETEKDGNQVKDSTNLNPPVPEFINRDSTNTLSTVTPSVISGSPPETAKDGNQVKDPSNLNPPVPELINRDSTNTRSTDTPSVISGSPPEIEKDGNDVKDASNLNPTITELINRDATNVLSTVHHPKGIDESKDERRVTPEVHPVANFSKTDVADLTTKGKDVGKRQPVPVTAANKTSMVVEASPSVSGLHTPKTKNTGNTPHGSPQVFDGEVAHSASKGTRERKTRRASTNTSGKESSRKRSIVKEKTPARQSGKGDKSTSVTLTPSSGFQLKQPNDVRQYGPIDAVSAKPFALLNASTSSLPDLNTSASPPVLFQQPFTDIQQVQLRAQIFVYGALNQGTAPDEADMISAFGGPDGGRSIWENAWRSCMERQRGQKSHPANPETPLQSRSGLRAVDSAGKQSALQGKGVSSPVGRVSSKAAPTIVNPLIPLSSPLWSLPTPSSDTLQSSALGRGSIVDYQQAFTSLHPYQTPPLRNFLGHNTSWMSQAPLRGPWISSPTPAPDNSSPYSASPITDTAKLSSVKGSSVPPSSGMKNAPLGLPASSEGLQNIFAGTAPLDSNNVMVSHAQRSSDQKPKKRKRVAVSEDLGQKAPHLQSQLELTPVVSNQVPTAASISNPLGSAPITAVEKPLVSTTPLSMADHLKSDWNVEQRILSNESVIKVKEARASAEEASVLSAAAVNHSLEIWKQLDKQKNSGLVSDIEAKLASAAVAIAAAAAVAKAAAAAANVASNAALQAKLMADEALVSSGYENSRQIYISEGMSNLITATPASILKGADGTSGSASIIVAAKEAAKRKVEAASSARKRAENMDAIVKAAELAAEAVSQAGKIVTMGDPLPLSDLVEAGPEGCWKETPESTQQVSLLNGMDGQDGGLMSVNKIGKRLQTSNPCNRDISSDEIGKQNAASEKSPPLVHEERSPEPMRSPDSISTSMNINEKSSKGSKGRKVSNVVNQIHELPESMNLEETNIKEGSFVEVFKDGEGFKAAWFTANILSLKDGKAYVCYNVLVADKGEGPLKEWVSLEGEGDKPPRIRTARPLTGLRNEGTRKRRRSAMVDYTWSVGDRVDAWIQESWQEGVITDKNKKDETTLTVNFPASGETLVVRAWHLRPSLIWKDGKWVENPKERANESSTAHEGDTPHEKRPKRAISKGIDVVETVNTGELRLLDVTENDKVFNIGKDSKNENNPDTHRMVRTGLQKEGSRVVFGVPKPGKKRKFMEVSKHYVADGTSKKNDGNDSIKLANFLKPQSSGSFGWKNSSKSDVKEKHGADSRPKTFKSTKPQSVLGRVVPPKGNTYDQASRAERIKDSSSRSKNASLNENQVESASHSGSTGAEEGPILYSSLATSTDSHPPKKTSTSRASKGKLAPAGRKLGKVELEKASTANPPMKSTSEVIEPRRSNRRIQPTSRLLEGLQSSLIITKIPSSSHDKGHKNHSRNASRGNKHG